MSNLQYQVTIPLLDEQLKKLAGFDSISNPLLQNAMTKSVIKVQGGARENAPVGVSGRLRQSIGYQVSGAGSAITGWVGSTMKDEVYPSVMELGRRPGTMPPPSALERWVHLVLGVPENEVAGVAFLVARSIMRRGIKGRFFLLKAYMASLSSIENFFYSAIQEITKALKVG